MWRMERPGGLTSHLILGCEDSAVRGVWFLNSTPMGARDFSDMASALQWADRMQALNWSTGWRLASDEHD